MDSPKWKSLTVNLHGLKPYENNPRTITELEVQRLQDSINTVGYHAPIVVDYDDTIIAGHQRYQILKAQGVGEVDVRKPDRKLTDDEFKQINIQDNVNFGRWDYDVLANVFELDDLVRWNPEFETLMNYESDDDTPTDADTPKERFVFSVECEDISELEQIKRHFKVTDEKITYSKFISKI